MALRAGQGWMGLQGGASPGSGKCHQPLSPREGGKGNCWESTQSSWEVQGLPPLPFCPFPGWQWWHLTPALGLFNHVLHKLIEIHQISSPGRAWHCQLQPGCHQLGLSSWPRAAPPPPPEAVAAGHRRHRAPARWVIFKWEITQCVMLRVSGSIQGRLSLALRAVCFSTGSHQCCSRESGPDTSFSTTCSLQFCLGNNP